MNEEINNKENINEVNNVENITSTDENVVEQSNKNIEASNVNINKDKSNKTRKGLIVIIGIISVLLIALTIYVVIDKKDNNIVENNKDNESNNSDEQQGENQKEYSKIDESKGIYYTVDGNKYNLHNSKTEFFPDIVEISFDYPMININTESVKKLNNEIKMLYEELEKSKYYSETTIKDESFRDWGCATCLEIKDGYHCNRFLPSYDYKFSETSDWVTLMLIESNNAACATYSSSVKFHTISKIDGKVYNNSELINIFGYNSEQAIEKLRTFIKENNDYSDEYSDQYIKENMDNLQVIIHKEQLIFMYYIGGQAPDYVVYDGKNFKELDFEIRDEIYDTFKK